MSTFNSILVPTDFSAASRHALEIGIELASKFDARLTVAHFWEVPPYPYFGIVGEWDFVTPIGEAAEKQLANAFMQVQARLPHATSICRMGSPWQEILRVIEEVHVDLVVMGTHARRGLSHALLGSVAEKIVRTSPVPVLTVQACDGAGSSR